MKELTLSVVIAALVKDNKILLIQRKRGSYIGFWALPGGKIEKHEHLSEAATREILEESGIQSEFKEHLGFVSEHLVEQGEITQHFLLHLCELTPQTTQILNDQEGKLAWFDLHKLEEIKDQIIPSDYLMIEKILKNKEKNYFDCVLEKVGEEHFLRKFE